MLDHQFDAASDLDDWILYDGPYGSGPHNCATPSHASVSDGVLRMLMRYETSGACGAGWYTAGLMVDKAFGGVDQRVTLRFRIVNGGVTSHHNLPLRWPTTVEWPLGGEETELCIRATGALPGGTLVYEPAAVVDHSVLASRGRISYFLTRCYSEGISKAYVVNFVGRGPACVRNAGTSRAR